MPGKFRMTERTIPRVTVLVVAFAGAAASAETIEAQVNRISDGGVHERLGTVAASPGDGSLAIYLRLSRFPPGWHAMHLHEHPDCGPALVDGEMKAGGAAGAHYDPTGAMDRMATMPAASDGKSSRLAAVDMQPRRARPLGDLPAVFTEEDGTTDTRILSYRLDLDELRGRSLILHAHPEATDDPRLPDGGGPKIACAVFPE